MLTLLDPETGSPLEAAGPHLLVSEEGGLWPMVAGIAWLRVGRDELRAEVTGLLQAGKEEEALVALLRDQDDFCPTPPPSASAVRRLLADEEASFRAAMAALAYGRVGSYFAHRWSAPTYLSGLAVMGMVAEEGVPLVEIACGTGQLIAEAAKRGFATFASDVVFSKCWLGKRYISPDTVFVCCDAVSGSPPFRFEGKTNVFCHDAFYFFPDKKSALGRMRGLAGGGRVGIGHAHTDKDPTGIAGTPLPLSGYKALTPEAVFFDDAELTSAIAEDRHPAPCTAAAEAVSFIEGGLPLSPSRFALPLEGTLQRNPLLKEENGTYRPEWPDEGFASEYRHAAYLSGRGSLPQGGSGLSGHESEARRRLLLDLPERW
jgi:hypothetical protein